MCWINTIKCGTRFKKKLNIKLHSMPVYDKTNIEAKVRDFDDIIKTNFLGNKIPKEKKHYTCIDCVTIDSVMKMRKENYPQGYLEECKYQMKKPKISKFIEAELESGSGSKSESKSDTELMAKLESGSDSDSE